MAESVLVAALIGVVLAPLAVQGFRRRPEIFLTLYLWVGLGLPYWLGLSALDQFIPLIMIAAAAIVPVAVLATREKLTSTDLLFVGFVVSCLVSVLFGGASWAQWSVMIFSWLFPFILGYTLRATETTSLSAIFAPLGAFLGLWAIVELLADWHPFRELNQFGGPWQIWASIQYRAGLPRSEAAMGHSITLGNVLALTIPFVIASQYRRTTKAWMLIAIFTGILCTFSRNALLAGVLALLLSAVRINRSSAAHKRTNRVVLVTLVTSIASAIYLSWTYASSSQEIDNSTDYRLGYLSLLGDMRPFGPSPAAVEYAPGQTGYASNAYSSGIVTSIDSSLLLLALQFGFIPAALFITILATTSFRALHQRSGDPAIVAAVALIPSILSVAMITQLPYIYFLVLGIAARASRETIIRPLTHTAVIGRARGFR